jgi:hypothetical protein
MSVTYVMALNPVGEVNWNCLSGHAELCCQLALQSLAWFGLEDHACHS